MRQPLCNMKPIILLRSVSTASLWIILLGLYFVTPENNPHMYTIFNFSFLSEKRRSFTPQIQGQSTSQGNNRFQTGVSPMQKMLRSSTLKPAECTIGVAASMLFSPLHMVQFSTDSNRLRVTNLGNVRLSAVVLLLLMNSGPLSLSVGVERAPVSAIGAAGRSRE